MLSPIEQRLAQQAGVSEREARQRLEEARRRFDDPLPSERTNQLRARRVPVQSDRD